jgi:ferredoxin-NADP reductase
MALKIKMSKIGILDVIKFATLHKTREKIIAKHPANPIKADYPINNLAKTLHPDAQDLVIDEIIEHIGADAKTYILKSADNKPCAYFRAGQYLSVLMTIGDSLVTRPYSISSSPKWALEGKYAITVRNNPEGFAAKFIIDEWEKGDHVTVSAPEGTFYYDALRDNEEIVAIAGGSGITPFLSMAYAIRDGIENFNLTIIFGSKTEEAILFKSELDKICAECNKVKVIHVLSDEKKEGYEHGLISVDLIKKYAPYNSSIFICGSESMYNFVMPEVEKIGLDKKYVRCELLGVTKNVASCKGYPENIPATFNIKVKQGFEEYNITANSDEPVLVALERAGINAPSRCRSGECGFCRSKLLSGEVFCPEENEYRRFADIQYGYIHPCAAFAISDLELEVPGSYLG